VDDQLVYIFADESCLGNQFKETARPGAAAGLIEQFSERTGWRRRDFAHFEADTTNNRMAIVSERSEDPVRSCSPLTANTSSMV